MNTGSVLEMSITGFLIGISLILISLISKISPASDLNSILKPAKYGLFSKSITFLGSGIIHQADPAPEAFNNVEYMQAFDSISLMDIRVEVCISCSYRISNLFSDLL